MKYALCVGNNYVGTDNELAGCVNDANDWSDMLLDNGYDTEIMTEAGAGQVLEVLNQYVASLKWGDRFIFTYSGHGTWVPDRNGDEVDMRDEAMYMADGSLLMDDDINSVFWQIYTGRGALVLSDSCFSGTVTRFADPYHVMTPKPRFIGPEKWSTMLPAQAARVETTSARPDSKPGMASLISGCGDFEYSYDAWFNGRANGAFSRAAIDAYRPGQSLSAWFKAIRATLPSVSYPQSPELTAASLYRRYAKAL